MNTTTLFQDFHLKTREEISDLCKQFLDEDFFVKFPELKNEISIAITGSVASGYQDEKSDLDLAIFFNNEEIFREYKFKIIDNYRDENKISKISPIKFHGGNFKSFAELEEELSSWQKDWLLREISEAIILHDPNDVFVKIQQKYSWYPDEIFKDKMNWLFAESSFLIFDRYKTGMTRKSLFYVESVKIRIIGLSLITLIMLNKKYPKSEKHLQRDAAQSKDGSTEILNLLENILLEKESDKIFSNLCLLRNEIEKILIDRKIIAKEDTDHWIGLGTNYKIEIEK